MTERSESSNIPVESRTVRIAEMNASIADLLGGYWVASPSPGIGLDVIALIAAVLCVGALFRWRVRTHESFALPIARPVASGLRMLAGMTLSYPWEPAVLAVFPAALAIFVASADSLRGIHVVDRRRLVRATLGTGLALLLLGYLSALRMAQDSFSLVLWLALSIHLMRVLRRAIRDPRPERIAYVAATFSVAHIAFDATIATAGHGWPAGLIVLCLMAPGILFAVWRCGPHHVAP